MHTYIVIAGLGAKDAGREVFRGGLTDASKAYGERVRARLSVDLFAGTRLIEHWTPGMASSQVIKPR